MQYFLFFAVFSFLLLPNQIGFTATKDSFKLCLNIPSFTLEVYQNDEVIKHYLVAVGKASTPTPTGNFYIQVKEKNPTWIPYPEKVIPAGPNNPLGIRWLGFFSTYGLHGTNMPNSIGKAASNGCIRMNNDNVAELYNIIPIGTPFIITYQVLQVHQDDSGEISLAAFPDIYGWGGLSLNNLYRTLSYYGLDSSVLDQEYLLSILKEHNGIFTPIGITANIILYGHNITEKAITINHKTYLPLIPLLSLTSMPIKWNTNNTSFNAYGVNYNIRDINKQPYLVEQAVASLFSVKVIKNSNTNTLEISNDDEKLN